ncbi:MAG: NAD-dependent epimerase/dehydratase family protein [bacterium]
MKRALIIGYGFTGWSIDRALSDRQYKVVGLRRDWDGPEKTTYSAKKITGDITVPETLDQIDMEFDLVVNCVSSGDRGNTKRYRDVYLEGGRNVINWCVNNDVPKLIYTGSSSVYGDSGGDWVNEETPTATDRSHVEILTQAEQEYYSAHHQYEIDAIVCRLTGIYGPGRSRVLRNFRQGRVTLKQGGTRHRNMVRREDVGKMIGILAEEESNHQCYNLTDNEPVHEKTFFQWLSEQMGREMPPVSDEPSRRSNKQVTNQRFMEEFDVSLEYPTYREGYRDLINAD